MADNWRSSNPGCPFGCRQASPDQARLHHNPTAYAHCPQSRCRGRAQIHAVYNITGDFSSSSHCGCLCFLLAFTSFSSSELSPWRFNRPICFLPSPTYSSALRHPGTVRKVGCSMGLVGDASRVLAVRGQVICHHTDVSYNGDRSQGLGSGRRRQRL